MLSKNIFLYPLVLLIFHLIISVSLFVLANSEYLSYLHNGSGVWNFAKDSNLYHKEALISLEYIQQSNWSGWWNVFPTHHNVKLISLSYWLTGYSSPISFSVFNSLTWSISVLLIFNTVKLLFPGKKYLPFMTVTLFFQPSLLFGSTQLLRDPIFLLGISFFCYGWALMSVDPSKWKWLLSILLGFFFSMSMRGYLYFVFFVFFALYLLWIFYVRKVTAKPAILLLILMLCYTFLTTNKYFEKPNAIQQKESIQQKEFEFIKKRATDKIDLSYLNYVAYSFSNIRSGFSDSNQNSKSIIDGSKEFRNFKDVLMYIPRAIQIGFLSPFPHNWVETGKHVGLIGRIISGAEMLIWYTVLIGFFYVLMSNIVVIHPLAPIVLVSIFIVVLLGYSVPNMGAIFRMRQGYMIPIYIYGMYGIQIIYIKLIAANVLSKKI